jgi:hypothetical protein
MLWSRDYIEARSVSYLWHASARRVAACSTTYYEVCCETQPAANEELDECCRQDDEQKRTPAVLALKRGDASRIRFIIS